MPCYEKVVVSVDLIIKDRPALEVALRSYGVTINSNKFSIQDVQYTVLPDGKLLAEGQSTKTIDAITDSLRHKYTTETVKNWAAKQRMTATVTGNKISLRKWVN